MRAVLLSLGLLLSLAAAGFAADAAHNDSPRLFGKSYAQILAMGETRWMAFQSNKAGSSTADISEGLMVYRDALQWRNDRLAAHAPAPLRREVAELRPLLTRFTDSMILVRMFPTGGGSMWSNIHASVLTDSEDTLYHVLGGPGSKSKPRGTGEVLRMLSACEREVEAHRHEAWNSEDTYASARKSLGEARSAAASIFKIAAKLPRKRSDAVLDFCVWVAKPGLN